jgi:energy-coupling factor transporter ATP-binding protein EcfA2
VAKIISVRGTSGSGKTTLVKEFSGLLVPSPEVVIIHGDTIGSARAIYQRILSLPNTWKLLVVESLLWSEDIRYTNRLRHEIGCELLCIYLDTPLQTCLDHIYKRQQETPNPKPGWRDRIREKVSTRDRNIQRVRRRLLESNIPCATLSYDQSLCCLLEYL